MSEINLGLPMFKIKIIGFPVSASFLANLICNLCKLRSFKSPGFSV